MSSWKVNGTSYVLTTAGIPSVPFIEQLMLGPDVVMMG